MRKTTNIISYLFNPISMPLLGVFLVFNTNTYLTYMPDASKNIVYITIFVFTFLLPLINLFFLKYKGLINSLQMETHQERRIPYAITIGCYILAYYFLKQLPLPPVIYLLVLGGILSIIIAFIITLKWKVSVHMIGIGGITGAIIGISYRFMQDMHESIMALVLIAGLIGFSRLYLSAHKPSQIYAGYFIGLLSVLGMILWN